MNLYLTRHVWKYKIASEKKYYEKQETWTDKALIKLLVTHWLGNKTLKVVLQDHLKGNTC